LNPTKGAHVRIFLRVLFIISVSVTGGSVAQALEFSAGIQHAGYLGEKILFAGIENDTGRLGLDFLLGRSEDSDGQHVDQISFKFRYLPWRVELSNESSWQPVYLGVFGTYTTGNEFFYESESKYPEKNYYDATLRRFGLLIGTSFQYQKLSIYSEIAMLDKAIENQVVAHGSLPWRDILSASLGIRWNF